MGGAWRRVKRAWQADHDAWEASMAWQGLATEFLQVPAVTRTYTAACVLTTAAVVSREPPWGSAAVVTAPGGCQAAGTPQSFPALLQPAPRVPEVPGLEAHHQLPLLRAPGIQLLLQHALRVPLLPHAGGGLLPRPHGRLRLHVSLRGRPDDSPGAPGQPLLPGPGPHSHAGVRVEPPQPWGEGQLLRPPHLPGAIPALGAHGLLNAAGQLHPGGPAGDRGGPCLLLPGGRLPQPAWRQEAAADPQLPETATGCPSGGPQLPAPPRGAARTPAAVRTTSPRAGSPTPTPGLRRSCLSWRPGPGPGPLP